MRLRSVIRRFTPNIILRVAHRVGVFPGLGLPIGSLWRTPLNGVKPLSTDFGFDRGGAIDRYYIERFLLANASHIKGNVLEVADAKYTRLFGGNAVTKSDVLHVNDSNPLATVVADLSNASHVKSDQFDCFIFTQTLHLIYQFREALQTCYRILKPGGTLLMTVPGITHIDQGEWGGSWYWAFTEAAVQRMVAEVFPAGSFQTQTFGNVLVAASFLYGVGLPEMKQSEMDAHDPHYQVIITVKATKPAR